MTDAIYALYITDLKPEQFKMTLSLPEKFSGNIHIQNPKNFEDQNFLRPPYLRLFPENKIKFHQIKSVIFHQIKSDIFHQIERMITKSKVKFFTRSNFMTVLSFHQIKNVNKFFDLVITFHYIESLNNAFKIFDLVLILTGGQLIEFHLTFSVDRKFLIIWAFDQIIFWRLIESFNKKY